MKIHNLSLQRSIACQYLAEIRDVKIQQDRQRFRNNISRLGRILAYELSKTLEFSEIEVETPLAISKAYLVKEDPVLLPIMRAALPFYEGFQEIFDKSDAGFVGAFRSNDFSNNGKIELGYSAVPDLSNRQIVILDPMLATGKSIVGTILELLAKNGTPKNIHIVCLLATPAGLGYLQENIDLPFDVWCVAIDDELNDKAYIVPGLGDAGDLAYGPKL